MLDKGQLKLEDGALTPFAMDGKQMTDTRGQVRSETSVDSITMLIVCKGIGKTSTWELDSENWTPTAKWFPHFIPS